jgi:hypothetical protein
MSEPSDEITHTEAKNARVPTELHCPVCNTLHVDQDDWVHKIPHRKHLCANCRHIWQPYAVGTVGVDFHATCREKTEQLERDLAWTRGEWTAAGNEIAALTKHQEEMASTYAQEITKLETRRDELLAMVAKLSQAVPLESEVAEALNQRGALLAEIGTLKATIAEHELLFAQALNDRVFLDDVIKGVGPFVPRGTQSTVAGIVGAVKYMHETVKELQRALHKVCEHATTHLPEDREVINETYKLAAKDYFA